MRTFSYLILLTPTLSIRRGSPFSNLRFFSDTLNSYDLISDSLGFFLDRTRMADQHRQMSLVFVQPAAYFDGFAQIAVNIGE